MFGSVDISSNTAVGLSEHCGQITCGGGAASVFGSATLQADNGSSFVNNR